VLDFTAGMLGGLARRDQRAWGELYVRKSTVPMAQRSVARWSAASKTFDKPYPPRSEALFHMH
jgi:hypothetical protein